MKGIFCTKLDNIQSSVHSSCQRRLDSQPADVNGEILQVWNHDFVNTRHFQMLFAAFFSYVILFSEVLMLVNDC